MDILLARRIKLNSKFKWTDVSIKRVVRVSNEFLDAWEEGVRKARVMVDALNTEDMFEVEITLYPEILTEKEDEYSSDVYDYITGYLNPKVELNAALSYNAKTKSLDEDSLLKDSFLGRDLNWNIELFGELELQDHFISYSLHVLYSHNHWAFDDILKINNIMTEINIIFEKDDVF